MAGTVAAVFPDTDILTTLVSPLTYLTLHRGVTHSFLLLPLWTLLLALLMGLATRKLPAWRSYLLVCALGIGIHILGDWITSFGTMFLAPLSHARFALGTTFIIDLVFNGIIARRAARLPAVAQVLHPGHDSAAGAVRLRCTQAWLRQQAIECFGERYAQDNGLDRCAGRRAAAPPLPATGRWWSATACAGNTRGRGASSRSTADGVPAPLW